MTAIMHSITNKAISMKPVPFTKKKDFDYAD